MVRALSSSVSPTMFGDNFQIYSVQITGKCICETPTPWHDLIISPPYVEKLFWEKKVSLIL